MKNLSKKFSLLLMYFFVTLWMSAQSLEHPVIWTTQDDKADVLDKINKYDWAEYILEKAKSNVDAKVNAHISNPASILNTIPAFASDDNLSETNASSGNAAHAKILNYASYAAMVYYVTGETKYAQFAADILWFYIDELESRTPDKTAISGSDFYDPRCSYAQFAIAYDFVINYMKQSGTKIYQSSTSSKISFDNTRAQKAVHNIAMNALHEHGGSDTKYGKTVSNHPILRSPGVLFPILCVEDDTERERMFNVFWNVGTKEQNSFTKTILPMFGEQGIWPEAVSYSFMQNITLILNVVDRLKPELKVMDNNKHILDGNFLFDNLRMPNRRFVRYGDSHRDIDKTAELYRYTLNLSLRNGYDDYVEKAQIALRQGYDAAGGYTPQVPMSTYGNYKGFEQLFWGVDIPTDIDASLNFQTPTVLIEHAGVALQRNTVEEDNVAYGLCGIIGGAHYVHSHCTGITMELYGADHIMVPNAGLPVTLTMRSEPEHENYFWRHAGNNTMIVNGTTHGTQPGSWNTDSYLMMNTTVNVAAEPKHLEDPINPNFSFATQFLDDKINEDQQQRTLAIIRTSETSGYYLDVFRSKSLGVNNFHDYIYHNIGDVTHINTMDGTELGVKATTRYQNDIGDYQESPGWRFFEDTKVTEATDAALNIRFDLEETNTFMNMFVPAGVSREYTKALGPATREAKGGYISKQTQVLAIRQQGEAWEQPYVHVFEPSQSTSTSVKSVEYLYDGDAIVGAKVVSSVGYKDVVDYIICQEDASQTFNLAEEQIEFTGRFAVVRKEQTLDDASVTLYIGEGSSLTYEEHTLTADNDKKGQKVITVDADTDRILYFKNIVNNQEVNRGANLDVEALVGDDFSEVTLFVNKVNVGTKTSAPYTWTSVSQLTSMIEDEYTLTLEAIDGSNEKVTISVTVVTSSNTTFSGEGIYKIYNPDKAKWLAYNIYSDDVLVTNTGDGTINKFNIVANGDKYNIYTEGEEKILIVNSTSGHNVMLATPTSALLASGDALFTIPETQSGSDLFLIKSGANDYNLNVKSSGSDIGRGTTSGSNYQWSFTQVGNFPSGIDAASVDRQVGLTLFPNPTKGIVCFEGDNIIRANMYTMSGQLMKKFSVSNNHIDVSQYESGMYLLQVEGTQGFSSCKRLIILK